MRECVCEVLCESLRVFYFYVSEWVDVFVYVCDYQVSNFCLIMALSKHLSLQHEFNDFFSPLEFLHSFVWPCIPSPCTPPPPQRKKKVMNENEKIHREEMLQLLNETDHHDEVTLKPPNEKAQTENTWKKIKKQNWNMEC